MRIASLFILLAMMTAVELFELGGSYDDPLARTMIGFGFLIFAGMVAGELARRVHLPKITGYLAAGMLCGPHLIGLVDLDVVERLKTVDELALALIAFTAGGELRLARLKSMGRSIIAITALQTLAAFLLMTVVVIVVFSFYMPLTALSFGTIVAIALLLGLVAAANSPSTTVAVIVETKSKGYTTDQVMSVTVTKDFAIILLTAIVLTISGWIATSGGKLEWSPIGDVLLETFLSLAGGGAVAVLIIAYLRYVRREMILFVVAVSLLIVFASGYLHLHFLLVCMTAGFCVENFSRYGESLIAAIERTSMTVYVIFFAIAGASVNFSLLRSTWLIALAFVVIRAMAFGIGTASAGLLCGESRLIVRRSWMGYLGQAGVSLGIASLVLKNFPDIGPRFYSVIITAIAINQIIGPIALKALLSKAGETAESRVEEGISLSTIDTTESI